MKPIIVTLSPRENSQNPLPSAATRAISNKAFNYKETRDGFNGNSYDFDGIEKNKDFH